MTCAVLSIGTELTRGELVNTNATWLSASLTEAGFEVVEILVVDDDPRRIVAALERLGRSVRVIVTTGGLGPTTDDLTTASVATLLGVGLVRDEASQEHIRRRFERAGRVMGPSNAKQADFPEGAMVLPNPIGTAPGFAVDIGMARAFFMPGVPREMQKMFEEQVLVHIRPLAKRDHHQVRIRTFGLPESAVGERLSDIESTFAGITIGYRAHFPEIEVKVLARGDGPQDAQAKCEAALAEVRHRLADVIFGEGVDTYAGVIGRQLRAKGLALAIAESCTGGLIGHMLTREPGASDFLLVDAVTYANTAKSRFLGVDEEVIRGHGAVSAEVAAAMAEGVRRVSGADLGLSITGIAGPTGGTDDKPVGTVYVGLAQASGTEVKPYRFTGDRHQIQTLASYAALALVRQASR